MELKHLIFGLLVIVGFVVVNLEYGLISFKILIPLVILAVAVFVLWFWHESTGSGHSTTSLFSSGKQEISTNVAEDRIQKWLSESDNRRKLDLSQRKDVHRAVIPVKMVDGEVHKLFGIIARELDREGRVLTEKKRYIWDCTANEVYRSDGEIPSGEDRLDPFYDIGRFSKSEGFGTNKDKRPERSGVTVIQGQDEFSRDETVEEEQNG